MFSHVFHVGFYSQTLRIGVVAGYATGLVNTVPLHATLVDLLLELFPNLFSRGPDLWHVLGCVLWLDLGSPGL